MPDLLSLAPALGTLLVLVVLGWFAVGTQLNVRKGERAMRWLQDGLPLLGPRTTVRWLGSSVADLTIVSPHAPLRAASVLIVLEPRDLGALWLLSRARGRRDFLLLRLDLRRAPRTRVDLVDPRGWTARDTRRDDAPFAHEGTLSGQRGQEVLARYDDDASLATLRAFWERIDSASAGAWRISVRSLVPHVEVHALLPSPAARDSRTLLAAVHDLVVALG
jgi:hypothetical protein